MWRPLSCGGPGQLPSLPIPLNPALPLVSELVVTLLIPLSQIMRRCIGRVTMLWLWMCFLQFSCILCFCILFYIVGSCKCRISGLVVPLLFRANKWWWCIHDSAHREQRKSSPTQWRWDGRRYTATSPCLFRWRQRAGKTTTSSPRLGGQLPPVYSLDCSRACEITGKEIAAILGDLVVTRRGTCRNVTRWNRRGVHWSSQFIRRRRYLLWQLTPPSRQWMLTYDEQTTVCSLWGWASVTRKRDPIYCSRA